MNERVSCWEIPSWAIAQVMRRKVMNDEWGNDGWKDLPRDCPECGVPLGWGQKWCEQHDPRAEHETER